MGNIAERVAAGLPTRERRPGIVDRMLSTLDDEDRAIVMSWLHDATVAHTWIEQQLAAVDITVSDSEIGRWRRQNVAVWAA